MPLMPVSPQRNVAQERLRVASALLYGFPAPVQLGPDRQMDPFTLRGEEGAGGQAFPSISTSVEEILRRRKERKREARKERKDRRQQRNTGIGAGVGAVLGGTIGTIISPGAGTTIGAGVGGTAGGAIGRSIR